MALRKFSLGDIGQPDSEFDSVARIRPPRFTPRLGIPVAAAPTVRAPQAAPQVTSPLSGQSATVGPTLGVAPAAAAPPQPGSLQPPPPQPPTIPPPTPPPAPAPTPDTSLNFEGSTFNPTTQPTQTTTKYAPNEYVADELLNQLQQFSGLKITEKWRELARANPEELLRQVKQLVDGAKQVGTATNRADSSFRQRLDDWYMKFQAAIKQTATGANPEYEREQQRQMAFNNAKQRLTQQLGYGARDDESALISMLAERGLLNSGIAAREIARMQAGRTQAYNDALSGFNEKLLLGELGFLDQSALMRLQSALQLGNEKELMRFKADIEKSMGPDAWAQILGSIGGAIPGAIASAYGGAPKKPDDSGYSLYHSEWQTRR